MIGLYEGLIMIEILLGISSIIAAIIFFILGTRYGKMHNKKIIKELKDQKKQNKELNEKITEVNQQNSDLIQKTKDLESQNNEQKEMLEKSIQAIGSLNEQNKDFMAKIDNLEVQLRSQRSMTTTPKKQSEINKLIADLAIYGAKQWGRKKIDEWLYPDD
jgi:uncharacterized protein YoxC